MKLFYLLLISLIFQLTNIPILFRGNLVNASENVELKNSNDENNPVKTVIANGYGINIDDAAQNAAKNALTNVVGKFIDAETKLSKKVEIENGLVNQSKNIDRNIKETKIMGNIFFPNETDYFTPSPNLTKNIWFSRDLEKMSSFLNSSPKMLILSSDLNISDIVVTPLNPNFVNNHLQYLVTWFSMAAAWLFMSVYLIARVVSKHRKAKN